MDVKILANESCYELGAKIREHAAGEKQRMALVAMQSAPGDIFQAYRIFLNTDEDESSFAERMKNVHQGLYDLSCGVLSTELACKVWNNIHKAIERSDN